ncbi:MAG: hypothetical protein H8E17_08105 [Deltaproteobacteria bacterium]|nr:hypothetical protein [Deltaproteobacteria bacterium]
MTDSQQKEPTPSAGCHARACVGMYACSITPASCRHSAFAPKVQNNLAQGNALGLMNQSPPAL